jgi:hypothetical protein
VRDVEEAICRVRQTQYQGGMLNEDELVQAADLLGAHLGRADAREAAATVMHWLGDAGGRDSIAPPAFASPGPAVSMSPANGEQRFSAAGVTRLVGAGVLSVLAVVLWFVMAPDDVADRAGDVAAALDDYRLNEAQTQGAPQQQVVNGWVAKDLLTIVARQTNDAAQADHQAADRLAAEVALGVVALSLALATRTSGRQVS